MKMYVANGTRHHQDFIFRLPENPNSRIMKIPVGSQVQVPGDLSQKDIDAIVEQHGRYGLVPADSVDSTKTFIGMCYSIGAPVKVNKISAMDEHNQDVLEEAGRRNRTEAAIATHEALAANVPGFSAVETSIVEDTRRSGSAPRVDEGFRVSRDAPEAPASGRQNPRQRKGR